MVTPDKLFGGVLLGINLLAFWYYGKDKQNAIRKRRRTPEKCLLLIALAGGAFGALFGMLFFHHKTRHRKFRILLPLFALLWSVIIWFLYFQ